METRYLPDPQHYPRLTTAELRATFLVENLFATGQVNLIYCDADRAIVGGIVPGENPLELATSRELASQFFFERREGGIINIGGQGTVTVDGKEYHLNYLEALYIGRGAEQVSFTSKDANSPACFYLLSYPAHKAYPPKLVSQAEARQVPLGKSEAANVRVIYQYIRPGIVETCQLVMGVTCLAKGSVWNTMPPHRHPRRTEIYLYFGFTENERVFHLMGQPDETRHLVLKNQEVVLSPSWSIHSGVGTSSYNFIWGMGGENQEFDDMDPVTMDELK
jgi:4-deoxy-L-threo-5-hexosulose-uronate ketol-isomerase